MNIFFRAMAYSLIYYVCLPVSGNANAICFNGRKKMRDLIFLCFFSSVS